MSKKRVTQVKLKVDVQSALEKFPFIQNESITFLDREEKNILTSLCDGIQGNSVLCCFWDRHVITGPVFKCPIRKVYKGEQKIYDSAINGNSYTIRDDTNTENYYFETDGYFCDVKCCWAFLDEEELRNPIYENSKQLILGVLGKAPQPAPHWRTLIAYGGPLSIEKFRASFKHKEFIFDGACSGVYPFIYKFKEAYHI